MPAARISSVPPSTELLQHIAALKHCTRCSKCLTPRPVALTPLVQPQLMLVGQAPGPQEHVQGRPFIGPSGKRLMTWFELAGMPEDWVRANIFFAAVTRCYPGPNKSGRGDRVPSPLEQDNCRPWLEAELKLINPQLIIVVGQLAARRFLSPAPLSELVGPIHNVTVDKVPRKLIVLPHPSGASSWHHVPENKALLSRALREIKNIVAPLVAVTDPSPLHTIV